MIREQLAAIPIKSVMTSPVVTVLERDDFHVVQEKMVSYDIRHLPVVDGAGKVVGMITQRQLYKICSPRRLDSGEWHYDQEMLDNFILKAVMLTDVHVLKPTDRLATAIENMVQLKIGCIPIVDDAKRPVGILTRDGILAFLLKV